MSDQALVTILRLLRAMDEGELVDAIASVRRLEELLRAGKSGPPSGWPGIRATWSRLLERRGYFVRTKEQLDDSLHEIHELGPGFDLHDLATALARCDLALTECLKKSRARIFPELIPFAPACECGGHGEKSARTPESSAGAAQ